MYDITITVGTRHASAIGNTKAGVRYVADHPELADFAPEAAETVASLIQARGLTIEVRR